MPGQMRTEMGYGGQRLGRGRGLCGQGAGKSIDGGRGDLRGVGRGGVPWGCARGRCFGGSGNAQGWSRFSGPQATAMVNENELLRAQLHTLEQEVAALKNRLAEPGISD